MIKEEPENVTPDRCDVCKMRLTENQTCKTESESQSTRPTTRRNPCRSAKRDVVYRENDLETRSKEDYSLYNINQHCWKCSEVQPLNVKTETLTMEDQSEPSSAGHLQSDILGKLSAKRFNCNICDKTFTLNSSLKVHLRTVHDKVRSFECPHCPHKATQRGHLKDHILTHTGEKNFKCDICDKKFTQNSHLKLHIRTVHDKVRAFECPHCPHKATQRGDLKKHILIHTRERNFKCDICDKKYTTSSSLKFHIRSVHDKVKAFECPHCPYKATTSSHLERHILTHTGEKNFKCNICDKTFTQRYSLRKHISTVHDKVKPFPCPHCPYKAALSGHLKSHLVTHTGEKNFNCDICDKKFTQNGDRKRHIRTVHDKVKAFPCPHCPYEAAHSGNLDKHILTHTGEKNFKCDICEKKFTQRYSLRRHIRTVHDKDNGSP